MALCSENPSRWHGRSILGGGRGCLLWGVTSARKQWCPAGYGRDKRSLPQHEKEKAFLSSPGLSRVHSPSQQPRGTQTERMPTPFEGLKPISSVPTCRGGFAQSLPLTLCSPLGVWERLGKVQYRRQRVYFFFLSGLIWVCYHWWG